MTQPIIVMGDKTNHGGTVVVGAPTATTHGKPIARLGDKVTCPKCGPTVIASGDSSMLVMGKPVARHGDKTACGATLIAGQFATVTGAQGGGGGGAAGAAATGAAQQLANTPSSQSPAGRSTTAEQTTSTSATANDDGHHAGEKDEKDEKEPQNEPSGSQWVARFATSKSTDDLIEPFATNVDNFIAALRVGGASVTISATYRPPERAYLMYWAYKISKGADPTSVPEMEGVDIDWAHLDDDGEPDKAAAKAAALKMVRGYNIAYAPASPKNRSRHTDKRAIDMTITNYKDKDFVDGNDENVNVTTLSELFELGDSYSVIKLKSDAPHWSDDGH